MKVRVLIDKTCFSRKAASSSAVPSSCTAVPLMDKTRDESRVDQAVMERKPAG